MVPLGIARELLVAPWLRESTMWASEGKGEGGSRERRGVKPTPLRSASGEVVRRGRFMVATSTGSEDGGAVSAVSNDAARRFRATVAISELGRETVRWRSGRASDRGDIGCCCCMSCCSSDSRWVLREV